MLLYVVHPSLDTVYLTDSKVAAERHSDGSLHTKPFEIDTEAPHFKFADLAEYADYLESKGQYVQVETAEWTYETRQSDDPDKKPIKARLDAYCPRTLDNVHSVSALVTVRCAECGEHGKATVAPHQVGSVEWY